MDSGVLRSGRGGKREGAGRPAGPAEEVAKKRSVYLTDAEWDACEALWTQGMGKSEYVRLLVQQDMKKRREV